MATLYRRSLVNTTWGTSTAWSFTSGGASAGVIPTSADDVIFDSNSYTNISVGIAECASLTLGATYTGVVSANISLYGNLTYLGGNLTGTITATGTAACAINAPRSAINPLNTLVLTGNKTASFSSAITVDTLTHIFGALNTNNYTINCVNFNCTGGGTVNLGSSAVNVSGTFDFLGTTLLNAGTSTITLSTGGFANLGSKTFYNFTLSDPANSYILNSSGTVIFNLFTLAAGADVEFSDSGSEWIFTVLPVLGGTVSNDSALSSYNPTTPVSLAFPSSGAYNYLNLSDISVSPNQTAINSTDNGGNTGWIIGNPLTVAVQSLLNTAQYDVYNVTDAQTIAVLKTAIQTATSVQTTWFDIVYNSQVVSESATLASLGIASGSRLRTHNKISRLSTLESRQIAKLELAKLDRTASNEPRKNYDITELPTQYSGNNIVNNPNTGGLIKGRPWII
jgi:hypothetical protein